MSNKKHKAAEQLVTDAILGAYLGLFCAVAAMLLDIGRAREVVMTAQSPTLDFTVLLGLLSILFALGMVITGMVMRSGPDRETK
ncbi:MAG TPA: hypothetical protein VH678_19320 [Xanthobacteraceae bacterium]|jgi:hypothetical protein